MSTPKFESLNKFVQAGAGAGKTWNLTREVIDLALSYRLTHESWPRVVLTTFTRKATQELKERLLVYCLQEKPQALEFVQSSSFLTITTMHGLLSQLLSQKGYVFGLSCRFDIVDSFQVDHWRKKILRDLIHQDSTIGDLDRMGFSRLLEALKNFEQVHWTGKFRSLQVQDLEEISSQCCLDIANNLKTALSLAANLDLGEKWLEYFERIENIIKLLKEEKNWQEKRPQLIDQIKLLSRPRSTQKNPGLSDNCKIAFEEPLSWLNKITTEPQYDPSTWESFCQKLKQLSQLGQIYCEQLTAKKIEEASLETDDLEYFALKLVRNYAKEAKEFSDQIDAWFIDEFQDTSPRQIEILEPLIAKSSCYIVGDPQQSIYLFRGSRSEVFLSKKESVCKQGGLVDFLGVNYRSEHSLLEFFNLFFTDVDTQFAKMTPAIEQSALFAQVFITQVESSDREIEISLLSNQLSRLLSQGVSPKDICILGRVHSDIELLQKSLMQLGYPVLSHASSQFYNRREILDAMSLLNILINPWDNQNLVLFLRSPWIALDETTIVKLVGQATDHYWPIFAKHFAQQDELDLPGSILRKAVEAVWDRGLAYVFRKCLIDLGLLDYSHYIDPTGRREANLWKLVNLVEKNAREPGVKILQLVREGFAARSLEEFADATDASSPVEPNKINLMTVHASKGLQFEHVFMPFLQKKPMTTTYQGFSLDESKGLWSTRLPLDGQDGFYGGFFENHLVRDLQTRERQESLRVLYVGMTRAKKNLYLSWTGSVEKNSWGEFILNHLNSSQFSGLATFQTIQEQKASPYPVREDKVALRSLFLQELSKHPILDSKFESDFARKSLSWSEVAIENKKKQQGVLLHRLFESLRFHDVQKVLELGEKWLPEQQSELAKALQFLCSLQEPHMQTLLKEGHVEWGFQKTLPEGAVAEGRVDLWGVLDQTLWVVDYKTGSSRYKEKAFIQMAAYSSILKEYTNWHGDIKMCALFPFKEEVFVQAYKGD